MANLKDIRIRISSVKTTRQVTSAMKMVSAAKFKKAHDQIIAFRPYADGLNYVLSTINTQESHSLEKYARQGDVNRLMVVVITSNRGLCGAFNTNVIKQAERLIKEDYRSLYRNKLVDIIAIGKQGYKSLSSHGFNVVSEYNDLLGELKYASTAEIAENLIQAFINRKYDKVLVVYNEFINAAVQNVSVQQLLPIAVVEKTQVTDSSFIFEPSSESVLQLLIPKTLKAVFYRWLLESVAAEHGARMTSMHKATDNATEMIGELQLMYNKARQTAITNEILEIVGGAEALKGSS
jgi:F-type H+-transporting ATPase subunit gamma